MESKMSKEELVNAFNFDIKVAKEALNHALWILSLLHKKTDKNLHAKEE